jgi:hypothetical protein
VKKDITIVTNQPDTNTVGPVGSSAERPRVGTW